MKNHLAGHLNFIQICSLKAKKQSFLHLSIDKLLQYTSCYDDCNTFLYSVSTSVVQIKPLFIFHGFPKKNINFVLQFFNNNGSIKKWHKFKKEHDLHQNSYFQWVQLIDSIPEKWKLMTVLVMSRTRFQSESTPYICLNVKELLARSRRQI